MTRSELARQRLLAVRLVKEGNTQRAVAGFLGVHEDSVGRWVRTSVQGGEAALAARRRESYPCSLDPQQWQEVLGWLEKSPLEFGYANELWTSRRVADQIDKRLGIRLHYRYVSGCLLRRGITPQKPQQQPREKDQQQIERWVKQDWPRIKKKPGASELISC